MLNEGKDDVNIQKILEAAEGIDALHAIVLVVNGTDARINMTVENTFQRLKNMLPDSVIKNTIAVVTNCTSMTRYVTLKALNFK